MNREGLTQIAYDPSFSMSRVVHIARTDVNGDPTDQTLCGCPCARFPYSPWYRTTDEPTCIGCISAASSHDDTEGTDHE